MQKNLLQNLTRKSHVSGMKRLSCFMLCFLLVFLSIIDVYAFEEEILIESDSEYMLSDGSAANIEINDDVPETVEDETSFVSDSLFGENADEPVLVDDVPVVDVISDTNNDLLFETDDISSGENVVSQLFCNGTWQSSVVADECGIFDVEFINGLFYESQYGWLTSDNSFQDVFISAVGNLYPDMQMDDLVCFNVGVKDIDGIDYFDTYDIFLHTHLSVNVDNVRLLTWNDDHVEELPFEYTLDSDGTMILSFKGQSTGIYALSFVSFASNTEETVLPEEREVVEDVEDLVNETNGNDGDDVQDDVLDDFVESVTEESFEAVGMSDSVESVVMDEIDIEAETETETELETELETESETEDTTEEVSEAEDAETEEIETLKDGTEDETDDFADNKYFSGELSYEGTDFVVRASLSSDSEFPTDIALNVSEIISYDEAYAAYYGTVVDTVNVDMLSNVSVRLFDIKLMSGGIEYQPAEGSLVSMTVGYDTLNTTAPINVVHCSDEPEVVSSVVENDEVIFEATSFSVYAIVETSEIVVPTDVGWSHVASLDELTAHGLDGFLISHVDGYFATNDVAVISNPRTGILKTSKTNNPESAVGASLYYFEPVGESGNQFLISCMTDENVRAYVKQSTNSLQLVDRDSASVFTLSHFDGTSDVFRLEGQNGYCWNMQRGAQGQTFAAYNDLNDVNARFYIWKYTDMPDDVINLDGKEYSVVYLSNSNFSAGMTSDLNGNNTFASQPTIVRSDVIYHTYEFVASGEKDLATFTFHNISENYYYMTMMVDGVEKYLSATENGLCLLDEPDDVLSVVTAIIDDNHDGQFQLSLNGKALGYSNNNTNGVFTLVPRNNARGWINLATKFDDLSDDDFVSYCAYNVSVSDEISVTDGTDVVLYMSIWNPELLAYEYYVVDYDGRLIPCYVSGDSIGWIGTSVNTALWNFIEYRDNEGSLTYYYDLQNVYSGQYLAPQMEGLQVLSDVPIGVNLNGRRYGDAYSKIVSWNDKYYSYAGLNVYEDVLTVSSLSDCCEFYFAVMEKPEELVDEELLMVDTLDNNDHGISMWMYDWNDKLGTNRERSQANVLGQDTNVDGLLRPYLESNGYPMTDGSVTGVAETSLATLFQGGSPVNHLFIEGVYNEDGYFEYDSTQNFAHLESNGNFTVYEQIAQVGNDSGPTRTHGQFMPYNSLQHGRFSSQTNQTDIYGNLLSDLNPRKGEKLYSIPSAEANYFFGMEMEASFVQTESGLDAWGHDIVFEFSGDDDFWLYVDGSLVLDLGGIHSASTGTINFKTGEVHTVLYNQGTYLADRSRDTTLYELFRENYVNTHSGVTEEEVLEYLDGIFELNNAGQYVFKDYTSHTMKMFYMERGAGASNLHMRFNLASAKPNTVSLSKTVTGSGKADFALAEFPYQIYYRLENDFEGVYYLLEEEDIAGRKNVVRKGERVPVKYMSSYTPVGLSLSYDNVFFLGSGDNVEIRFPSGTAEYKVVECAVNEHVYDNVSVNKVDIEGTPTGVQNRFDYDIGWESIDNRRSVNYENHVSDSALRILNFTKVLYDSDGETLIHNDGQPFSFRLYLGNENATELTPAFMQEYYVKNENMEYCRWDSDSQSFISLGTIYFDDLNEEEIASCTFVTSPNGSISKIPADYTVEVRDLLVGAQFKVEERVDEIPHGYELIGYDRVDGSYIVNDGDGYNEGRVRDNADPTLLVNNKRGWGLIVKKEWSDDAFVSEHADIYLAVYANGVLVPDSLQVYSQGDTSKYWYFDDLPEGTSFDDYGVKEVVVNADRIIPVNDVTVVGAVLHGEDDFTDFSYHVDYEKGSVTGTANNVREDVIRNVRDGLRIEKVDMNGNPLADAHFVLLDADENPIGKDTYVSDETGYVMVASLPDGEYVLREISPPDGYGLLSEDIGLVFDNGDVSVEASSEIDTMYEFVNSEDPVLYVKNKPVVLDMYKEDEEGNPLSDAHFAIYKQVLDNQNRPRKDYFPVSGFEDMVSDVNGLISSDLGNLSTGVYYLSELSAPEGYDVLTQDILFEICEDGSIVVSDNDSCHVVKTETDDYVNYRLCVINTLIKQKIRIRKVDSVHYDSVFLPNAEFDLYLLVDGIKSDEPLYSGMISDENGFLVYDENSVFDLLPGDYLLEEVHSPSGYKIRTSDVTIHVMKKNVYYSEGRLSESGVGKHYDAVNNVYTLDVSNVRVMPVPITGFSDDFHRQVLFLLFGIFVVGYAVMKKKKMV